MKVLLTGGAGFIGSHTVDLLLEKGYEVRILDSLEPPVHPQRKKPNYIPNDVEFILGDVRNKNDVEKVLQGVDVVYHLAAYQGYLTDFSKFAFTNDGSTALLYEVIVEKKLPVRKVILGSSQAVYGEGKHECPEHGTQYPFPRSLEQLEKGDWEVKCSTCGTPLESLPTDESSANPHNQYAVSKYSQELYALTLGRRFDIPTVVLRYSITQGPRQSFHNAYSGILRIFTIRLLSNIPPIIFEDGRQLRDYVYVGDVARANLLVMQNDAANYEVYNVGGGEVLSVAQYTNRLLKVVGKDIVPQIPGEFRFGDTRHVVSDISKLKKLGWEPKTSFEQTMREYIEWAEAQPGVSDYYAQAEKVMKREGVIRSTRK
ncbi:NAD-dependent epimerase/dehydratase family protein [Dehalococcoidia bacterium]|nr:NAD-dependent epimerase/dehydratase family protein [Dehalococcoidia bacterium]